MNDEEWRQANPAYKIGHVVPISHDILVDFTDHKCDDSCPPPYVASPMPLSRRLRYRLRSFVRSIRRLPGYRLVHQDDIRGWDE